MLNPGRKRVGSGGRTARSDAPTATVGPALRLAVLVLSLAALLLGLTGAATGQSRHYVYAEIDEVINPTIAGYLERAVEQAADDGAELIIVRLDTPGGFLDSTRDMVTALLESDVPSVVYVAPGGAHAASAGTFITAAAHVAVMAPGTNIGAASPVGAGGEELPETIKSKATEDAAALMRDIAEKRGRNSEALEATVLEAVAYSSQEAVALDIVDFTADDLDDVLDQLHGMTVETPGGSVTLDTEGLEPRRLDLTLAERFVLFLSDPNVYFILITLGGLGLVIELFNPGLIVPAVVGVMCLLLAFVATGNLPVNWAGFAFLGLALLLLFLEIQVSGVGLLGIGAVVSFVVGGLLLFNPSGPPSPTLPGFSVNLWVLLAMAALLLGGGGWFVASIIRERDDTNVSVENSMVGQTGTVVTGLMPRGTVRLASEVWTAVADDDQEIGAGERVRVVGMEGLALRVSKLRE
ncbi:MAG: nodulation protein NfeD [Chloroflexota bacterium]|nr:nodulation protein NfeD [Chloroflexota bacterium]MDE2942422.1 nodulation protein NfeD [Chloroflexota bacterium]MDE3267898.1 nodulation protein NfeD [Chloroflexota bacterium]